MKQGSGRCLGRARVDRNSFGRAELTATETGVSIALASPDEAALESLREVVASHLTRFARTPVAIRWFEQKEDGSA